MVCLYYFKMQDWGFTLSLCLWINNKITLLHTQNHFRVIWERKGPYTLPNTSYSWTKSSLGQPFYLVSSFVQVTIFLFLCYLRSYTYWTNHPPMSQEL